MGPAAHQTGRQVAQLGQFDLEFALERACPLGEDVQDQPGTVDHPTLQQTLQIALLGRREGMVEDHQLGPGGGHQVLQFLGLTGPDEKPRIRDLAASPQGADQLGTGRLGQEGKFLALVGLGGVAKVQMDQDGPLTGTGPLKHGTCDAWAGGGYRSS